MKKGWKIFWRIVLILAVLFVAFIGFMIYNAYNYYSFYNKAENLDSLMFGRGTVNETIN